MSKLLGDGSYRSLLSRKCMRICRQFLPRIAPQLMIVVLFGCSSERVSVIETNEQRAAAIRAERSPARLCGRWRRSPELVGTNFDIWGVELFPDGEWTIVEGGRPKHGTNWQILVEKTNTAIVVGKRRLWLRDGILVLRDENNDVEIILHQRSEWESCSLCDGRRVLWTERDSAAEQRRLPETRISEGIMVGGRRVGPWLQWDNGELFRVTVYSDSGEMVSRKMVSDE